jgi:DNA polymerase bacteriophage-type
MSAVFLAGDTVIVWVPDGLAPDAWWEQDLWPDGWEPRSFQCFSGGVPGPVRKWIQEGYTFAAHNAEVFDAEAWERLVGGPQPSWYDTIHCCRAGGLPAALDKVGRVLTARGKDTGKEALKLLYTAKHGPRGIVYPVGTVQLWKQVLAYNIADVLLLERVYEATRDYGESDVLAVNSVINERGCPVDVEFAVLLKGFWAELQMTARKNVSALTEGEIQEGDVRSVPKVKAWLARNGLPLFSLNRASLEELMRDPDGFFGDTDDPNVAKVTAVIRNRQAATMATAGKLDRLFAVVDDDFRVRGSLTYHGAHTGRWSGRDLQPHNMPRGIKLNMNGILAKYHAGILALKDVASADALATLFRPIVCAGAGKELAICDYASVEGRGIAWVADDATALAVFADTARDIYCEMASALFGREITKADAAERQIGKIIVLGCGYGMGANKFGSFCRMVGADLAAVGVTAEECVRAYRETYPAIPSVWRGYQRAVEHVLRSGGEEHTGKCAFFRENPDTLVIVLPSGRELRYRGAKIVMEPPIWAPTGRPVPVIKYASGWGFDKTLYGGLLAENIVQALCRDFLAHSLVLADRAGLSIVLHVHDEIVCEEEDAATAVVTLAEIMSTPPNWARGFPLRVEGYTGKHYTKGALKNALTIDYLNGRAL